MGQARETVQVGDVVRLFDGAFGDGIVFKVYEHETCGVRADVRRPYVLEVKHGAAHYGCEEVNFLDAEDLVRCRLRMVR